MNKKKNKIIIITILIILLIIIIILFTIKKDNNKIDYSKYNYFVNKNWTRTTESDTEYLKFNSDGTLTYYCSCGSPINNSDICNKYIYDESTQTIKLKCSFFNNNTVKKIKILEYSETTLKLEFKDEIRQFDIQW